jgi:hypothetical protein
MCGMTSAHWIYTKLQAKERAKVNNDAFFYFARQTRVCLWIITEVTVCCNQVMKENFTQTGAKQGKSKKGVISALLIVPTNWTSV